MADNTIRIVLDEEKFRRLVAGKVAFSRAMSGQGVEIILSDIGWGRMVAAISAAMRASGVFDNA